MSTPDFAMRSSPEDDPGSRARDRVDKAAPRDELLCLVHAFTIDAR